MILNFFLGSQPSGIPLILHGLPFGFQPIEALFIIFHHYFIFFSHAFFFFWSFSPSLLLLLFLFQLWLQERLQLLHPPTVPLSTYLSRHLRDR